MENKTKEIIEQSKQQLKSLRSNRPSPVMVEDILAEAYGQKMAIKQLGAISIVPPAQIQISVWDQSVAGAVAKAVESSNLKIAASVEGNLIRINLPPLSNERRQELVKTIKREVEDTRIKIRFARDEAMKKVGKDLENGDITEDEKFMLKDKIQEIVDKANQELESVMEKKIKEIEE